MDVKNIERGEGKVSFQVVADPAAFEAEVNKAYQRSKGRITVPGFRKGKAPRMVIEGMYGKDVFYEDAVNAMALEAYQAGVKESGERTVGDPAITDYHVDDDKTLTISFEAALYPEATLGEYKGLTAYKAPANVGDDEIQKELEAVQKRNARIVTVDRGAQEGDTLTIDFDGYRDGKRFRGGKAEGHKLTLGSGAFVPGFEEQLVGAKAGEEKELDITFPEDYAPELAGAAVVFKVKVHEVQETQLPALDDEFAKDVSEFDTLEEYKADLKKGLEEKQQASAEDAWHTLLLKKASENMTAEIPDAMVNARVNNAMEDLARRCRAQGYTLERYLQAMGLDERTYRGFIRPSAANEVRLEVLLEKVAEAEGLVVSKEEIEEEYKSSAERFDITVERLKEAVSEELIERDLKIEKARKLIWESGVATDVPEADESADKEEAETESADKPEE